VDKDDNGTISFDEFRVYFRDGVMTSDELRDVFDEIDTNSDGCVRPCIIRPTHRLSSCRLCRPSHSPNTHHAYALDMLTCLLCSSIETGELGAFFSQNIGKLSPMFASLSGMNREMSTALQSIHSNGAADSRENFFTRFFLKEIVQALSSLQSPLQVAINAMTEATRASRPTTVPDQEVLRAGVHYVKSKSSEEDESRVAVEVDRLALLVDKLAGKVHCGTIEEQGDTAILAAFEMDVLADQLETFQIAFTNYLGQTPYVRGCIRATATHNDESVTLYLIFESETAFDLHLRSESYRGFQRVCADTLARPLKFTTVNTPLSWW
jgi:quinol monooxygenase YgiN